MSRNKGSYRNNKYRSKPNVGENAREIIQNIDENNPVMKMFQGFATELDAKHDRYERIVKLSRDITIEAKRIIFLLHTTNTDVESKRKMILEEAQIRLEKLITTNFKLVATELNGQDANLYHRAYTGGMQEFIEALVFYQYLKTDAIEPYASINKSFTYETESGPIVLLFPQLDYILGIADFTGELMRRCINNLGVGNVADCFKICNYVRHINTGFLGTTAPGYKEIGRKCYVLRQSLSKMELVCYNIQIRGSEVPKHMLACVLEGNNDLNEDADEGFY